MKIDVWDKDMQVIGDYAKKIKVPVPMFDASKPIYIKAMKAGLGAQGHRRRLRRAGEDGQAQARQGAQGKVAFERIACHARLVGYRRLMAPLH